MNNLRKSFIFSFFQKYSELLIGFFATLVLARLLGPEEVGIYSIVASIIVLAHMVRDFGVSSYIVKESDLNSEKLISAFFVTAIFSFSIGLLLLASSGLISDFFNRDELVEVVYVVSIIFFIIPFGSVSLSLLRRKMNFVALFKVNVSSSFLGAFVSIFMAYKGFSYMSLAWGSVVGTSATVLLSTLYREKVKLTLPRYAYMKDVLLFGMKSSYIQVIFMTVSQLPEIIIGKLYGMAQVGLFSRANGLVKLFHMGVMQGVIPVILPYFVSVIKESGVSEVRREYLKFFEIVCFIAWPFFIFVSVMGEQIILILYGDSWLGALDFLVWLCVAAAVVNTYTLNAHVFIALDKIDVDVKVQTISQFFSIGLLVVAGQYGIEWLLGAIVMGRVVTLLVSFFFLTKVLSISLLPFFKSVFWPLLISFLSWFVLILANDFVETGFYVYDFVIISIIFTLFYLSFSWVFGKGIFVIFGRAGS